MLVLSRKKDEKIVVRVGDKEIVLTVVLIDPKKVRLGIEAPEDVVILREELLHNDESAE